jgi:hypothetical protein
MILAVALALIILVLGGGTILMASGGKLGYSDILTLALNAGFTGQDAVTATAIALAESSGDPGVVGDTKITPGGSVGLWQINLKAHPEFDPAQLTNPQYNANAAFSIYSAAGDSFTPWTTFKTGAYSAYLPPDASAGVNA